MQPAQVEIHASGSLLVIADMNEDSSRTQDRASNRIDYKG